MDINPDFSCSLDDLLVGPYNRRLQYPIESNGSRIVVHEGVLDHYFLNDIPESCRIYILGGRIKKDALHINHVYLPIQSTVQSVQKMSQESVDRALMYLEICDAHPYGLLTVDRDVRNISIWHNFETQYQNILAFQQQEKSFHKKPYSSK